MDRIRLPHGLILVTIILKYKKQAFSLFLLVNKRIFLSYMTLSVYLGFREFPTSLIMNRGGSMLTTFQTMHYDSINENMH